MQQLKQLKSKQFQREATIGPIARTTSYHTIDSRRMQQKGKQQGKEREAENHFNLANIVQGLLEMKPQTAFVKSGKRTEAKMEMMQTISHQQMRPGCSFDKKAKSISVLHILGNSRKLSQHLKRDSGKEEELKHKLLQMDARTSNTTGTARIKSSYKSSTDIGSQTIVATEILQRPANRETNSRKTKVENFLQAEELKPEDDTSKPRLKTKLAINNLNKFASLEGRREKSQTRHIFKLPKHPESRGDDSLISRDRSRDIVQMVLQEKKVKRCVVDAKIPDFIKVSLSVYQQDSQFRMACDKIMNKADTVPLPQREQDPTQQEEEIPAPRDQIQGEKLGSMEEVISRQQPQAQLSGAKLKLAEKNTRKTTRLGEYIRSKREQLLQPQGRPRDIKHRQKPRPEKHRDGELAICGWEEVELLTVETLDLGEQ